jgi:hypothetical protein
MKARELIESVVNGADPKTLLEEADDAKAWVEPYSWTGANGKKYSGFVVRKPGYWLVGEGINYNWMDDAQIRKGNSVPQPYHTESFAKQVIQALRNGKTPPREGKKQW